jgi:DNA-binding MarR family transcriptional regulator
MTRPLPSRKTIQNHAARFPEVRADAVESYLLLQRTGEALADGLKTNLTRYNLTGGKFRLLVLILEEIEDEGRFPSPSQLAERAGLPRATVTDTLDSLETQGYIVRQEDAEDRRGFLIHLTEAGREVLQKYLPDYFGRIADLLAVLSDDEQAQLRRLLRKVYENTEAFSRP